MLYYFTSEVRSFLVTVSYEKGKLQSSDSGHRFHLILFLFADSIFEKY